MKPIHYYLLLLFIPVFFMCTEEDEEPFSQYFLRANIDGVEWVALPETVELNLEGGLNTLSATALNGSTISITWSGGLGAGEVALADNSQNTARYTATINGTGRIATTEGVVVITSVDEMAGEAAGTFNFVTDNGQFTISAGAFNAPITGVNTGNPPGGGSDDYFMTAKVDGADWEAVPGFAGLGGALGFNQLVGLRTNGSTIAMNWVGMVETGTIQFGLLDTVTAIYQLDSTADISQATSGSLVITEVNTMDSTITGTFSFTTPEYEITEGAFYVPWSAPGSGGDTTANQLTAELNGDPFESNNMSGISVANFLTLTAVTFPSGDQFLLNMPEDLPVSTPQMVGDAFANIYGQYITDNGNTTFYSSSGTITITEHNTADNFIKGTFEMEMEQAGNPGNTITVTMGSFETTYL